jgi:hypothetical protein
VDACWEGAGWSGDSIANFNVWSFSSMPSDDDDDDDEELNIM